MTDTNIDLIHRFLNAINDSASARRAAFAEILTPDFAFTDPIDDVQGPDALAQALEQLQQQSPDNFRFTPTGTIDAHHQQARFSWQYGADGEEPAVTGQDIVIFDGGRIHRIYGFVDSTA
ncbi:nuclear transport factor 2 family protein [Nocardia amamiensis]|uniref:nuclear transport factor 2 family protein n=1 Tax=Nocardia TaxID=1817 RepID=UPI0033FCC832